MSGSLESFSRRIHNALQAQQSHILQALDVHSYDIHQKLSAIQCDVESLRNETLSQQNAFRSAFDIVAARLDEIQQISQTLRPTPLAIAPAPHKDAMEDHRILLDAINTRIESTENRLGRSMGDVAKKILVVEHNVAEIFETVKNPRASCNPTSLDSVQASLAELQKTIKRLPQGPFSPQQPAIRAADPSPLDPSPPTPAQSDNHKTPPKGTKLPESAPIEPQHCIKQLSSPPKPSLAREPTIPEAPVGDVRWSLRLDKQQKSRIDALFSADSPLSELGPPLTSSPPPSNNPPKKGKESVLHNSSTITKTLGKRKRGSGVSKRRKKGPTTSNTAAKGKKIVRDDESDQPPVMVMCNKCDGWYHISCVSVNEDDPCMAREDVPYTCPPCGFPDRYTVVPRDGEYDCGAPGCVIPKYETSDEVFYVDKLIGRKPINDRNSSAQFAWLVKFDGYPVSACLWKPEDTFDAKALKLDFYSAATKEGILSSSGDHEILLLREAADYGGTWGDDEA